MRSRDPRKAIEMLDRLTTFFDGGRRWIKYDCRDAHGNACLVGALDYFADRNAIDVTNAVWYLRLALPGTHSNFVRRRRDIIDYNDTRGSIAATGNYNDTRRSFTAIGKLIARARKLAQAELEAELDAARLLPFGDQLPTRWPDHLTAPLIIGSDPKSPLLGTAPINILCRKRPSNAQDEAE